jgi:hypothetical protein
MNLLSTANTTRNIRVCVFCLLGLLARCLVASELSVQLSQHQNNETGPHAFVGTWNATFKGKIFATIKLEERQGKLVGTVRGATIQLDSNGKLTSAHAIDSNEPSPILDAKFASGVLRISAKETNSADTVQFEMRITGTDEGELRLLAPPEVTAPKPWKVERAR